MILYLFLLGSGGFILSGHVTTPPKPSKKPDPLQQTLRDRLRVTISF